MDIHGNALQMRRQLTTAECRKAAFFSGFSCDVFGTFRNYVDQVDLSHKLATEIFSMDTTFCRDYDEAGSCGFSRGRESKPSHRCIRFHAASVRKIIAASHCIHMSNTNTCRRRAGHYDNGVKRNALCIDSVMRAS